MKRYAVGISYGDPCNAENIQKKTNPRRSKNASALKLSADIRFLPYEKSCSDFWFYYFLDKYFSY